MIPDEYLRREFEKTLTPEELEKIKSLGGLEKLIEEFKRQVEEAAKGEGKEKDKEGKGKNDYAAKRAMSAKARSVVVSEPGTNVIIRPTTITSS